MPEQLSMDFGLGGSCCADGAALGAPFKQGKRVRS